MHIVFFVVVGCLDIDFYYVCCLDCFCVDPRPITECSNSPCAEYEAGLCNSYVSTVGCTQCINSGENFKIDYNYPCVSCSDTFGSNCISCSDFSGCSRCSPTNDFYLKMDNFTGLNYCQPQPCLKPENNCQKCSNGVCTRCVSGYTMDADGQSCSLLRS